MVFFIVLAMLPTETDAFVVNDYPLGQPIYELDQPNSTFRYERLPLQPLSEGEVLVKVLYLSNDPLQRQWIRREDESYGFPSIPKGQPFTAFGLAEVIESKNDDYKTGDVIHGTLSWQTYSVLKAESIMNKVENLPFSLSNYLPTFGLTGLTGYFGIKSRGEAKKGDVVVISAASGATGSTAIQVAKALGCRVIGITGSDEKCKFVESIGADVGVNYKDPNLVETLKKSFGENGTCDLFFDTVGGEILETVLPLMTMNGTIVVCGAMAGYNDKTKAYVKNWHQVIGTRVNIKGYVVTDYLPQTGAAIGELSDWIKQGKLKVDESVLNVIDCSRNFAGIPKAWGLLFDAEKKPGKLLTKLGDPSDS